MEKTVFSSCRAMQKRSAGRWFNFSNLQTWRHALERGRGKKWPRNTRSTASFAVPKICTFHFSSGGVSTYLPPLRSTCETCMAGAPVKNNAPARVLVTDADSPKALAIVRAVGRQHELW